MDGPEQIGRTATRVLSEIAYRSPPETAAVRLKQLHEINPGTYHRTHNIQPDNCPHCTEETP